MVGLDRFELSTSRLSGVRSNHLSYRPSLYITITKCAEMATLGLKSEETWFLRKEVIQPQVPLRLPCYDFTPITNHTLGTCLPYGLAPVTSGTADFRGVTGGVYKARERIHRGVLIRDY